MSASERDEHVTQAATGGKMAGNERTGGPQASGRDDPLATGQAPDPTGSPEDTGPAADASRLRVDQGGGPQEVVPGPGKDDGPAGEGALADGELGVQAPCLGWRARVGTCSVGGSRQRNEDFFAVDLERRAYAISDGIGGAPYGDVIARVACNRALSALADSRNEGLPIRDRMSAAVDLADLACSCVSEWLGGFGSGATLLLAALEEGALHVSSVGDSMCFRLRDNAFEPLIPIGRASASSNALDSALGYRMALSPKTWTGAVREGDAYLLCTDGVWSTQPLESIAWELASHMGSPRDMAQAVVSASDMSDNATAVVLLVHRRLAE